MNSDFPSTFTKKLIDDILTEAREHYEKREDNEIWISELVACKYKSFFNQLYSEYLTIEPKLLLGIIVHKGVQEWLREKYGAETEIDFQKELNNYSIKGRVDAIANETIIEIKYASDIKGNEPYEHHILQLRLYLWLTEYEEGRLIYITPNRLIEFKITEKMTDDEVLMLIDGWQSPEWDWECNYCRFYSICNLGKRRR